MKKILRYLPFALLGIFLSALTYALVTMPPILAGMASKTMCSCVFVMGRSPQSVVEKEFTVFPFFNRSKIDIQDSLRVNATFLWSTRTAIYRKGLGCTLLAERSEEELRAQQPAMPSAPSSNQDSISWPAGDRIDTSRLPGVNYNAVQAAMDEAFIESDPEKPKNTLAVAVVYDGKIIGERYADGVTYQSKLMGWSMTKSLTNALVGVLVKEGKLNLSSPVQFPEWQNDDRKNITLDHLMHASSGLEWSESYFKPGHFHTMFMDSDDKGGYAASLKMKYKLGEHFEYSSGTTNMISKILRITAGDNEYPRFMYEKLFYRIGMTHTLLELDASGTAVGSSYGYASARDWARFGLLYLNDGVWNGERILPEGWVKYSSTPAPAAPIGEYGAQFWLNAGAKDNPEHSYHPGIPHDEYGAEGFERQMVYIIPSKKLVVVRLGVSHHGFDDIGLIQAVCNALP